MPDAIQIRRLEAFDKREIEQLNALTIDGVEDGSSIGFMFPMTPAKAEAFWRSAAASAQRGERAVLVAQDVTGTIVGTVSVLWAGPENQSHRADIAKMQVHRRARRQGVGTALLAAAERAALDAGRTTLVLDTVTDSDAYRLYARQGWLRCGEIPNYALWPDGRLCPTTVFYKHLGPRINPSNSTYSSAVSGHIGNVEIRPAQTADLPAITEIYNDVIATSTAVYSLVPSTLSERQTWFNARIAEGYPVMVAVEKGHVVGFSSFGEFRGVWPGYRYSVEHSVHVRADRRGKGIGSALVQALLPLASAMGKHVMIGGIDAANAGSLRMHERLGFRQVAHFQEVGHKFGRWLDLIFVQRFLDEPGCRSAPAS